MQGSRNHQGNVFVYCRCHHSVEPSSAANSRLVKVHLSQSARAAMSNNVRYNRYLWFVSVASHLQSKGLRLVCLCDAGLSTVLVKSASASNRIKAFQLLA